MTDSIAELEARRLEMQRRLDGQRSSAERNLWGQFATPQGLARQITRAALSFAEPVPCRFLDPSLGTGAFYSALLAERGERTMAAAVGVELDRRFAVAATELWSCHGLTVHCGDFTRAKPKRDEFGLANLVLANPPYVRHHSIPPSRKPILKAQAEAVLGQTVSGLSGLHVFFVLHAHSWMAEDGVAAWVLPGEWMDVNYGSALRSYFCSQVTLLRVHRFEPRELQFEEALVTSSVVFFRKRVPEPTTSCEFTSGSFEGPTVVTDVAVSTLGEARKWSKFFQPPRAAAPAPEATRTTLADLFDVRRGIATGANDFFVKPRAEFRAVGIPDQFLRPILPSSRHLASDTIAKGLEGYPELPEPLALLDCRLPLSEVRESFPGLFRYLDSARGHEVRHGYLARGRRLWYAQEQRDRAPILASYMGRSRDERSPFRFFWNRSDATATNGYLMLIPKPPLRDVFLHEPEWERGVVESLRAADIRDLIGHGRVYGGGLYKLEPRELGRFDVTELAHRLRASLKPASARI